MDNRDRDKKDINSNDSSSGSWDNEPNRSQPGDMQSDKGRSGSSEIDLDETQPGNVNRGEMDH